VTGPPILLVESSPSSSPASGERIGSVTVTRAETGAAPTLLVTAPAGSYPRLAAAADGRGVWVSEYRSRSRCALREVDLDGRVRRPAREVPCGVEPLLETPHGLWVKRWVNQYSLAGRAVDFHEPGYALLDPATLRAKASYQEAIVLGAHHVLTMNDQEGDLALRDLRTGSATRLENPSGLLFAVFNSESPLGRVSPDARYALVRLGNHSVSPQVIDLWLLDLTTGAWQQVPGMPVTGGLKSASETWAPDGRVVMLGEYGLTGPVLATWRPGDREVTRRPDPLPRRIYEQGLGPLLVTATS
jgi:hypothetical protein